MLIGFVCNVIDRASEEENKNSLSFIWITKGRGSELKADVLFLPKV